MPVTRRVAIQTLAAAGAGAVLPAGALGRAARAPSEDAVGVLYDPTLCVGCQDCIRGCAEKLGCDETEATVFGRPLVPPYRTVLHRHERDGVATFHKMQCMHCVDPACVSACMLGAMSKNADGSVTWNGDLCVGCRYCQIGCPFNVLRFEWDTPTPSLVKCDLCADRRAEGLLPACVDQCKRGALTFGRRADLLEEAHRRIDARPNRYADRVYGEHDGGGTSVLYLARAGTTFQDVGLPALGTASVPSLPETIQHTLYKGFAAPLALLGVFGVMVRRNILAAHGGRQPGEAEHGGEERSRDEVEGSGEVQGRDEVQGWQDEHGGSPGGPAAGHGHHGDEEISTPVGGSLLTWPSALLASLVLIAVAAVAWRFLIGLGGTTNLSDGYPMGLWIAFDVVTGTALACGGYAVALLVYLLNRGRYHPLVRAAVVTSALGYTLGGLSVLIDLGRPWNFYKIPLYIADWNFNSILLEVALCIMLYTAVLWIEVSPALLEGWRESRVRGLRRLALVVSPRLERAMPYAIAVGLLLPTMHQSSLGSMMLLAGAKLHVLWRTPMLPLLFLVSCVGMGYAVVTVESMLSSRVFRRPSEAPMLRALAGPVSLVLLAYLVLRTLDVVLRGELATALTLDFYGTLFLVEMALFGLPALGLLAWRHRAGAAFLATTAVMVILAGGLYRFSTFLIAFDPGPEWSYFPSVIEFAVTIGLVAGEILAYVILVKKFPILRGAPAHAPRPERVVAGPEPALVA
jgi:Ni/Fe-hydrogenase subunit HybB-like protein/Fe-S-cluster-containing dehydrogenase component